MKVETTPEGTGLAKIEIGFSGKGIDHNYPCPICQKSHAFLRAKTGYFEPCYQCQAEGYRTIKFNFKSRWSRFLLWMIESKHS
jgi:hypothetical protein